MPGEIPEFLNTMSSVNLETLIGANIGIFFTILAVIIILKGSALWFSARSKKKFWFWILLVTNTLGILPTIYLIWFRKRK